jgi:hypothetical protein
MLRNVPLRLPTLNNNLGQHPSKIIALPSHDLHTYAVYPWVPSTRVQECKPAKKGFAALYRSVSVSISHPINQIRLHLPLPCNSSAHHSLVHDRPCLFAVASFTFSIAVTAWGSRSGTRQCLSRRVGCLRLMRKTIVCYFWALEQQQLATSQPQLISSLGAPPAELLTRDTAFVRTTSSPLPHRKHIVISDKILSLLMTPSDSHRALSVLRRSLLCWYGQG